MRRASIWLAAAILVSVSGLAMAADTPSGPVAIESTSDALGIGVSWGDGKLSFKGKTYPFTIKGLSVIDLGVSKVSASGKVFNLTKVEDFTGNFVAGQAGAAVGGGAAVMALKNQNGVSMELTTTQTGVKLTLAAEGLDVKLK